MNMQEAIRAVSDREDLSSQAMTAVMRLIMSGGATPAQIGGFLIALRMKGETVDEISAAAQVMRELSARVIVDTDYLVDTCGTGGDTSGSFNISTASAFVVAAAGGRVAKHGNRSVSSQSGSADVLEAAGVNLDLTPAQVAQCIEQIGLGFLFAPKHHSAMKYTIGPRKEMGVRTIFNVLGPLTNPAAAPNQLLGVFSVAWLEPLAQVLKRLGSRHVMVVHAEDGLDEISIGAPTQVAELREGAIRRYRIQPEDFGLQRADLAAVKVADAQESLAMILCALGGASGPARDTVVLNAGAAIYVAGLSEDLAGGVREAQRVIDDGSALARIDTLVNLSQSF